MNRTTRITLEGQQKRTEESVEYDRERVDNLTRLLANALRAQLEDEIALSELKASLEEDE